MPGYELIDNNELKEIQKIFKNGGVLFRHSFENLRKNKYYVRDFENKFSKKFKVSYSLAVSSGTAALRVALSTLNLKPDDEVITQSFTFVATVEAIIEARAKPICCEIDKTLNIDVKDLIKKINRKTKAIIVVHMLGSPAEIKKIHSICKKRNIALIEDTAWGIGATVQRKYLGTWGRMGTFSFDYAKTITTGEGGMVVFKNKKDYLKAKAWHDHGHENNPKVPRWEDTRSGSGFNYRMTELQGAVGIAQLRKVDTILQNQRRNKKIIWDLIKRIDGIYPRREPEESRDSCDALVFFVKSKQVALNCRKELLKINISTKILPEATKWHFAYEWDHMPELYKNNKSSFRASLRKSKKIIEKAVSIPISAVKDNFPASPEKIYKALAKAVKEII
tara:strand:+ start:2450 stop:3625 length:1176 start_codon:yes stop_codon:yes gene_type:complete